jgi:hypothetical protein
MVDVMDEQRAGGESAGVKLRERQENGGERTGLGVGIVQRPNVGRERGRRGTRWEHGDDRAKTAAGEKPDRAGQKGLAVDLEEGLRPETETLAASRREDDTGDGEPR